MWHPDTLPEEPTGSCLHDFMWFDSTSFLLWTKHQECSPLFNAHHFLEIPVTTVPAPTMSCNVYLNQALWICFCTLYHWWRHNLYPRWIPESKNFFFSFLPSGETRIWSGVHRPQIIMPWNTGLYPVNGWDAFEKDLHGVFTPEKCLHAQTLILQGVNKFPNVLPGLRNPTKVCVCVCVLSHSVISSSLRPFWL